MTQIEHDPPPNPNYPLGEPPRGLIPVDQVIARIPDWQGKTVTTQTISGGLTNISYRVDVDGTPHVVRIPGVSTTELLVIDRDNEYYNTKAAADMDLGARIEYYLPDVRVMVFEFIPGETMSIAKLHQPGMPTRMAQSIKRLHSGPRFLQDFNVFRLTDYYVKTSEAQGFRIFAGYKKYLPLIARIEKALDKHPLPTVPCHNDLLAENFIDDGQSLRIIDYEYSGNNDPAFELGDSCQEMLFDEARIAEICAAYFGEASPDKLARVKLNMIMSDALWAMWSTIQVMVTTINFDFWAYAVNRWQRATQKMDSPDFEKWLAEV